MMRFINWINRAEQPIMVNGDTRQPKHPAHTASAATKGLTREQMLEF